MVEAGATRAQKAGPRIKGSVNASNEAVEAGSKAGGSVATEGDNSHPVEREEEEVGTVKTLPSPSQPEATGEGFPGWAVRSFPGDPSSGMFYSVLSWTSRANVKS